MNNEIKCPKCVEIFQADETLYTAIVKQFRNKEFQKDLKDKEAQFEKDKQNLLLSARLEMEKTFDREINAKKAEIIQLKSEIKSAQIAKQNMSYNNKIPVQGLVERDGDAVIVVVPNFEADTLNANVFINMLNLVQSYILTKIKATNGLPVFTITILLFIAKVTMLKGEVHTNTIESVWALFTRTLKTYIRVSKKHLQKYANETVFRYNTRKMKVKEAGFWLLQNLKSTKITWEEIRLETNQNRAYAGNV